MDEKFRYTYTRDYVYPGKNGRTALHVAKNEKVIELLLEAGWSPNLRDHDGNTAAHLHICSDPETSEVSIPSILLSYGCDIKIKNYDGETPMDYFESKMSKDSALRQSKQWSREYKKWIHNKAKYPPPQTEAVTGQIYQEKTMLIERRVKGMKFYMKMNMACRPILSLKMSWASGIEEK